MVAAGIKVPKHQDISIHGTYLVPVISEQFNTSDCFCTDHTDHYVQENEIATSFKVKQLVAWLFNSDFPDFVRV